MYSSSLILSETTKRVKNQKSFHGLKHIRTVHCIRTVTNVFCSCKAQLVYAEHIPCVYLHIV